MSLHRLQSLVYLAVAVVVYAVVDLGSIGTDPVVPVVTVADGGVGQRLALRAVPGPVSPAVLVQIDAVQPPDGPRIGGLAGGDFGLLHGLTAALDGFGGTGKQQDERDHGRGVA